MRAFLFILASFLLFAQPNTSLGQDDLLVVGESDSTDVTAADTVNWEMIFDDPYSIRKGFIAILPFYGELFATNVTAGFGAHGQYYHDDVFDIHFEYRHSYGGGTDVYKHAAEQVGNVDNDVRSFNYFEVGGTYHITDADITKPYKVFLYNKETSRDEWAARNPSKLEIPALLRQVVGGRIGGSFYNAMSDLNDVSRSQGFTLSDGGGTPLPDDVSAFTNVKALSIYVGGSYSWIRNFAIEFQDGNEPSGGDLILTTYLDVMFSPSIILEDVVYQGNTFSTDPVETNNLGFRVGIEGKFDRIMSWSYGVEAGIRPGVAKRGFFLMGRISFPVFGTNFRRNYLPTRFY